MPHDRDVRAFNDRATGYESGSLGRLHHEIANRAVNRALAVAPDARRVLDVGSGTGYVLRQLAGRLATATELTGVDPAPEMIRVAREATTDGRLRFVEGTAEHLPARDGTFDLVISTTSFDHWADQAAGLAECARVLVSGGHLVLTDQFSVLLWPTLVGSRRGKARTRGRATRLITSAGLGTPHWHRLYAVIIQMATATK
ncbi:MAG: class I SAM-dependent methyltransferase [Streptosporangiaceae bacterium]